MFYVYCIVLVEKAGIVNDIMMSYTKGHRSSMYMSLDRGKNVEADDSTKAN